MERDPSGALSATPDYGNRPAGRRAEPGAGGAGRRGCLFLWPRHRLGRSASMRKKEGQNERRHKRISSIGEEKSTSPQAYQPTTHRPPHPISCRGRHRRERQLGVMDREISTLLPPREEMLHGGSSLSLSSSPSSSSPSLPLRLCCPPHFFVHRHGRPQKSSSSPAAAASAMLRPQYVNALLPSTAFPTERSGRRRERERPTDGGASQRHTNILLCAAELKPHTVRDAYREIGLDAHSTSTS